MKQMQLQHDEKLTRLLDELGITVELLAARGLPFCPVPGELVIAEVDADGRAHHLLPAAAKAWHAMKRSAHADGVVLEIVSAFRDLERQADIIRAKLARNMPLPAIFALSAPPGYSEHHTGRAIDINTPGCAPTEEAFEHTEAFGWLDENAANFGFSLSYPRGNAFGFIYEPWHWFYQAP